MVSVMVLVSVKGYCFNTGHTVYMVNKANILYMVNLVKIVKDDQ